MALIHAHGTRSRPIEVCFDISEVLVMDAVATMVPVEMYLSTSYSPDCEYIDGEVQERNVGELSHSSVQKYFVLLFGMNEKSWGVRIFPATRTQVSRTRYRVPDLVVLRRSTLLEQIIKTPPLICVEILSPEDRMSRTQESVADYIRMGVQQVWVVDPMRRKVYFAERSETLQDAEQVLTLEGTEILVPVQDIFAELDEMERHV